MRVSVASDRGCYQDGVQLKLYYVRYIVPGVATIPGISSFAPGPSLSQINDSHVAEKWSEWKELWEHYSVDKEERDVQVTRDWTSIGPKAKSLKLGIYRLPRGRCHRAFRQLLQSEKEYSRRAVSFF